MYVCSPGRETAEAAEARPEAAGAAATAKELREDVLKLLRLIPAWLTLCQAGEYISERGKTTWVCSYEISSQ